MTQEEKWTNEIPPNQRPIKKPFVSDTNPHLDGHPLRNDNSLYVALRIGWERKSLKQVKNGLFFIGRIPWFKIRYLKLKKGGMNETTKSIAQ